MKLTIEEVVTFVIVTFEGKLYTDDPVDNGGATKYGITRRTLEYYRKVPVSKDDVKFLTLEEAIACGTQVFMIEPHFDLLLDWRTQLVMYDYGFHSGQRQAVQDLQNCLGQRNPDGKLGSITQRQANGFEDQLLLSTRLLTYREEFMQSIVGRDLTQRKYILGWWRRTTQLQRLLTS